MQKYPSKISAGLVVFLLAIILGSSVVMISIREWIGLGINILVLVFVAYTFMTTYYVIDHEVLKIRCGLFVNKTVAINTISKISESRNPVSAPAVSLDRLELFYGQDKSVLISPKAKKEFIDHLLLLNPGIEFKTP
ncbi:PH domain-containing protein [Ulvibacterium sp.]|uniref:PH domain-containing protein n=1 Tax=Ulvibacterium sp. TaxID=2665914 RepID=UPI002624DD54|nr:PH domain-containing protein [Ulvibacterium sp.]